MSIFENPGRLFQQNIRWLINLFMFVSVVEYNIQYLNDNEKLLIFFKKNPYLTYLASKYDASGINGHMVK